MVERGVVVRLEGPRALIVIWQGDECEHCDARLDCMGVDGKPKKVEAINDVDARAGDLVEVGVPSMLLLKVSFLVFFLPMLGALGGGFLGRFVALTWHTPMTLSVILGVLVALTVTLIPARILDRRARSGDAYTPHVTRIVTRQASCASRRG